jgi:hypothetical protein
MSHGSPPINGTASHRPCMRRPTRRSYPVRSALAAPHLLSRAGQTPHGSGDLQATCARVRQPLRANVRIEEGPPPPGAAARPPHARLTRGPPTVDPTWPPAPCPRLSREGGWGGLPQPRGEDEVHRAPRPTQGQTPPPWSPRASTLCPHPTPSDAAGAPPVCAPLWDCTKRHLTAPHERPIPCPQAVTRDAPVEDGAPQPFRIPLAPGTHTPAWGLARRPSRRVARLSLNRLPSPWPRASHYRLLAASVTSLIYPPTPFRLAFCLQWFVAEKRVFRLIKGPPSPRRALLDEAQAGYPTRLQPGRAASRLRTKSPRTPVPPTQKLPGCEHMSSNRAPRTERASPATTSPSKPWARQSRRWRVSKTNRVDGGLPSADRNNKATLLLTGPYRTIKSYAKDLSPRMVKLQDAS